MAGAIFNTVPPLAAGPGIKFDGERISTAAAPRNLLDNSDFRNPVNQRGQSSYTKGSWGGYTIDRWAVGSGTKNTVNIVTDGVSVKGGIIQWLEDVVVKALLGKKVTCAAKVNSVVYVLSGVVPDNTEWTKISTVKFDGGDVTLAVNADKRFEIAISCATQKTIEWAALYEGEYTAETLPEYQPKGYSSELYECMRFFQQHHFAQYETIGVSFNGPEYSFIALPLARSMRADASVIHYGGDITVGNIALNFNAAMAKTQRNYAILANNHSKQQSFASATYSYTVDASGVTLTLIADL